jgi:predicted DsbA family dithiol-disulfide isomerase
VLARGLPRERLYETLTTDGQVSAGPERRRFNAAEAPEPPMRWGNHPRVVVDEFCDHVAPSCKIEEGTVRRILERYGDVITFEWRDAPRPKNPTALLAAMAARQVFEEKGAAGFWRMHDCIAANVSSIAGPAEVADGTGVTGLVRCGERAGVDPARIKLVLDGQTQLANVQAMVRGADRLGVEHVPAFLVGGYYLEGVVPYRTLARTIERALADATGAAGPR